MRPAVPPPQKCPRIAKFFGPLGHDCTRRGDVAGQRDGNAAAATLVTDADFLVAHPSSSECPSSIAPPALYPLQAPLAREQGVRAPLAAATLSDLPWKRVAVPIGRPNLVRQQRRPISSFSFFLFGFCSRFVYAPLPAICLMCASN